MSEQTIARWNAIPLDRNEHQPIPTSLKRERLVHGNNDDDDDDDISLVSRSPSPSEAMDVDDHNQYDAYVRGPTREVITVDTKIKSTNKGFALLAKLGWVEGQPLGLSSDGRVDPVPFHVKTDSVGLGKATQDFEMIETTVSQRRELDSERQQRENEEQRRKREDAVARKMAVDAEISTILRAFYCSLCDKQFKTVAQYDEHTNSYAHHHKARLKDMHANIRIKPQEELEKQKEKERKREEKELRKMAAAKGIKMPKAMGAVPTPVVQLAPVSSASTAAPMSMASSNSDLDGIPIPSEPSKSGWASISGPSTSLSSSGGGFKKTGWATVGSVTKSDEPAPSSSISSTSYAPAPSANVTHTTSFRNAGWTSLDTTTGSTNNTQPPGPPPPGPLPPGPPPPAPTEAAPPPPPPQAMPPTSGWSRGGFASINEQTYSSRFSSSGFQPAASSSNRNSVPSPESSAQPPPPPPPSNPPNVPQSPSTPAAQNQPVRSSWQQFQKGARRR